MRNSWYCLFRRLASACVITGATAWSSAMCYAQVAADFATDPVYADGWQGTTTNDDTGAVEAVGDNGGFGFEPWDFDNDWIFPTGVVGIHDIQGSNTFNSLGTAWTLALTSNTDIVRAGRGFPALQVGQTIRVEFDNPTQRLGFRGYFIRFNSRSGMGGGGNICYQYANWTTACSAANPDEVTEERFPIGIEPQSRLNISRFEFAGNNGVWGVADGDPKPDEFNDLPLFDTDTAAAGVVIDLKMTGPDTYELKLDPGGPAATHTQTGKLSTSVPGDFNDNDVVDGADYVVWRDHLGEEFELPNERVSEGMVTVEDYETFRKHFGEVSTGGIDWLEFTFFNTRRNLTTPADTDFYIKRIQIFNGPPTGATAAVPEPSTFVYLVTAMAGLGGLAMRSTRGD